MLRLLRRPTFVAAIAVVLVLGAAGCMQPGGRGAAPASVSLLGLVNAQRAAAGMPGLIWCPPLERSAQAHSDDQALHNAMSHTGSDGSDPAARVARAGYFGWTALGENVAAGYPTADAVMAAWMNSPGHRANILNGAFTYFGGGIGWSPDGTTYWTEDFGRDGGC